MVNKLVSRGTSRRSSAPPKHSSTTESIINENLYNRKQFSAESYWIHYCSWLQILHKQPCEGTQIGCTAYSFEKNIIMKSEQIWINNQLANRILCIILFYLIQLRDHKDILLITSSHDSNLEVSSNLFKHSEIHMSLRFLSPAFIWDWMEDNETKNQMWPRFNGHSLAGLICKVDQTYW